MAQNAAALLVIPLVIAILLSERAVAQQCTTNCSGESSPVIPGRVPAPAPAPMVGGQWRGNEFIPQCPGGMAFNRETRQCLPAQNVGGVIPCSPDDKSFVPGRGWVSNCR